MNSSRPILALETGSMHVDMERIRIEDGFGVVEVMVSTVTYVTCAPVLTPPPTNATLAALAAPGYNFTGRTKTVLAGASMTVTPNRQAAYSLPFPSNGVIYVANGSCPSAYTPSTAGYRATSGCGDVVVRLVDGNLTHTGVGLLGLIANNFVRVIHPFATEMLAINHCQYDDRLCCLEPLHFLDPVLASRHLQRTTQDYP